MKLYGCEKLSTHVNVGGPTRSTRLRRRTRVMPARMPGQVIVQEVQVSEARIKFYWGERCCVSFPFQPQREFEQPAVVMQLK